MKRRRCAHRQRIQWSLDKTNFSNIEVILWDNRTVEDFLFHPKPQVIRTIKGFITIPCLIEFFFTLRVYRSVSRRFGLIEDCTIKFRCTVLGSNIRSHCQSS